jgi:hypothetical protein
MRIPEKRICDLCRNEIAPGEPVIAMSYPLDPQDVEMAAAMLPMSPIPGVLGVMHIPRPDRYLFEFCRPCTDGILPMLVDLKTEFLRQHLAERAAAAARREG